VDGKWAVTEHGRRLAELLARYADGAGTVEQLAAQYGYARFTTVLSHIRHGQLAAAPYIATFHSPEIGVVNLKVPVPAVPPVITPQLERRVLDRLAHNRTWNKQHLKFLLSGFLRCGDCGKAVSGQAQKWGARYRHATGTLIRWVTAVRVVASARPCASKSRGRYWTSCTAGSSTNRPSTWP
jgi:hypothetical protein